MIGETIETGLQSLKKGGFEEIKEEEENYTSSLDDLTNSHERMTSKISSD